MQEIDAARTRAALTFDSLVPALRAAFAKGCEVPARHVHQVGQGADSGTLLIMPAWNDEGFLGIKTVGIYPNNRRHDLPGLHSVYVLYDARTGVPLARLDGDEITSRRTAAAAALGADFLARQDAQRLLVLGTGRVASLIPDAMRTVRPIREVDLWNVRPESAHRLAAQWREASIVVRIVDDLEAAAKRADIISCATLAEAPLIRGEWLRPGVHLDLIGSFKPVMREADPECLIGNRVFVDTEEAPTKAGDLLDAFATGRFSPSDIVGTLAALCRGEVPGRRNDDEITVFKAVGTALEDLTAASLVYRQANAASDARA